MTIAMFRAHDARATDQPHHEHECGAHDECCIAAAVIPPEGLE